VGSNLVRERENDAQPLDAGAYKKEFNAYDVALKIFKEEIAEYDKANRDTLDRRTMGERTKLARKWYNDLPDDTRDELKRVASKWNKDGAPQIVKDRSAIFLVCAGVY
jgi:hypothetical protein